MDHLARRTSQSPKLWCFLVSFSVGVLVLVCFHDLGHEKLLPTHLLHHQPYADASLPDMKRPLPPSVTSSPPPHLQARRSRGLILSTLQRLSLHRAKPGPGDVRVAHAFHETRLHLLFFGLILLMDKILHHLTTFPWKGRIATRAPSFNVGATPLRRWCRILDLQLVFVFSLWWPQC